MLLISDRDVGLLITDRDVGPKAMKGEAGASMGARSGFHHVRTCPGSNSVVAEKAGDGQNSKGALTVWRHIL